jgi:hypothetical protein
MHRKLMRQTRIKSLFANMDGLACSPKEKARTSRAGR